jgi:hypothetical protein
MHRQRRSYSPPTCTSTGNGPCEADTPVIPHDSILSDIPEERTPQTTTSSQIHIETLDGHQSIAPTDTEAQLEKPPLHRRAALIPGFRNQPPFMVWLRHSWLDILTQLLCLLVAEIIYLFARPLMPRYFPLYPGVYLSPWGLRHGKPYLTEYITTLVSAIVSFAVPFVVMGAIGLWWVRDFWDTDAAVRIPALLPLTYSICFQPTVRSGYVLTNNRSWVSAMPSQPRLFSSAS